MEGQKVTGSRNAAAALSDGRVAAPGGSGRSSNKGCQVWPSQGATPAACSSHRAHASLAPIHAWDVLLHACMGPEEVWPGGQGRCHAGTVRLALCTSAPCSHACMRRFAARMHGPCRGVAICQCKACHPQCMSCMHLPADIRKFALTPEDRFFVLACDGVWWVRGGVSAWSRA